MNILVVAGNNYPSLTEPQKGTFVYKLIQEFVLLGNEVSVISPQKYSLKMKFNVDYGKELATIFRPKTLSLSNKKIWFINTIYFSNYFQSKVIKSTVKNMIVQPKIIYCHFIISGLHYYQAFPNLKLPVFIAVGEYNHIDVVRKNYKSEYYSEFINKVSGFIAVSPQVKDKLISLGVQEQKIIVEPNASDLNEFKPRDKNTLREKYGLPLNKKIVLFVGRFLENKGTLRVQEALYHLEDDVIAIFIGKGPQQPNHPKIVFSGAVEHYKVADYMALADVFVLPTLHEGSSNVIIEAMACGLPIVSSDLPEIRVQCKPEYTILVNPMDIQAIAHALNIILKDDVLRHKMSLNALNASKSFDIKKRAERILDFIKKNK